MRQPLLTSDGVIGNLLHLPGILTVEKFGRNTSVANGTAEDIWDVGGTYVFPESGETISIVSTEVDDTELGDGANTVSVQGLDENWKLQIETVILNGTTPVVTTTKWIRIFRMGIVLAGTDKTNAGNITATGVTSSIVFARITAGVGQTNMAIYTIPAYYTGYIVKWYATINRSSSANATAADVDLFRHDEGKSAYRSTQPVGIQNTGSGSWMYEFPFPLRMPQKSDIIVTAIPTADADITAGFSVILVPNG